MRCRVAFDYTYRSLSKDKTASRCIVMGRCLRAIHQIRVATSERTPYARQKRGASRGRRSACHEPYRFMGVGHSDSGGEDDQEARRRHLPGAYDRDLSPRTDTPGQSSEAPPQLTSRKRSCCVDSRIHYGSHLPIALMYEWLSAWQRRICRRTIEVKSDPYPKHTAV